MNKHILYSKSSAIVLWLILIYTLITQISYSASALLDSTHISYGTYIEATISSKGEIDIYTFDGNAGDKIIIRMLGGWNYYPKLELFNPNGTLIKDATNSYRRADIVDFILPASGRYTIFAIDKDGNDTGNYSLSLQCRQHVQANADTIQYDAYVEKSITPKGDMDAYIFEGSAGDKIIIRLLGGWDYYPKLELVNASGNLIKDATDSYRRADIVDFVLPASGRYTIFASDKEGNDTGNYSLSLQCRQHLQTNADTIQYDSYVEKSLNPKGDMDAYIFEGSAGDKIIIRLLGGWDYYPKLELFNPSGSLIKEATDSYRRADIVDFIIPSSGRYTIFASDKDGNDTGNYSLSLQCRQHLQANADMLQYDGYVESSITPKGDMDAYIFEGSDGDKIIIRLLGGWDYYPKLELFNPSGSLIKEATDSYRRADIVDVVLPTSGRYTIFASDKDGNDTGNYSLSLQCRQNLQANADTIQYDSYVERSITPKGDMDAYIFEGRSGDKVIIRLLGGWDYYPKLELFNASGNLIKDATDSYRRADIVDFVLPASGRYTIFASDKDGNDTGNYSFSLQCRQHVQANADTIQYDAYVEKSITPKGEMDAYVFEGSTGDKIIIRMSGDWDYYPKLELFNPSGILIKEAADSYRRADIVDFILPASGRYTIFASDKDGNDTGNYSLSLQCRQHVQANADTIQYDAYVEKSITPKGDMDAYILEGSAGDKVIIRLLGGWDYYPKLELFNSSGNLIKEVTDSYRRADIVDFILPASGRYTIFASDKDGNDTGNYLLSLQCRQYIQARADTIPFQGALRDSLTKPGQLKAYIILVNQPATVNIRMTRLSGGFEPYLELFNPNNNLITQNTGYSQANISTSLSTTGAYTIFTSDKDGNEIGNYKLYVNPPPDLLENSVVRIHFDHSKGMIDEITNKLGSNRELLDQSYNNSNRSGLERIMNENETICGRWFVEADSAFFEYKNPLYGSKRFVMKWGQGIGFELKTILYLTVADSFRTGAYWEPGGDNTTPYDSLSVNDPNSGVIKKMIPYSGWYQQLYSGNSVAVGLWDSRYDEIFGYRDIPERNIECGTRFSVDGPFHRFLGPDTVTLEFAIKDSASFWSWASGYEHNVGVVSILAPSGVVTLGTTATPKAVVRNYGQHTATLPVIFSIGSIYEDTTTVNLAPGQKGTVTFSEWQATQPGTFVTACSTALAGDQNTKNDLKTGSVTVSTGGIEIYSISPNHGGNTGYVTVTILGSSFQREATVKLTKTEQPDIVADTSVTRVINSKQITTTIDLREKQLGAWNVVVTNPSGDSAIFYNGFTIEVGFERSWVDIIGRDQIRVGREETYWIRCGNSGNVDACIALLISVPQGAELTVHDPSISGKTVALLGSQAGFLGYCPEGSFVSDLRIGVRVNQVIDPMWLRVGIDLLPFPISVPRQPQYPLDPFVEWIYEPTVRKFRENGFKIDSYPSSLWDILYKGIMSAFGPVLGPRFQLTVTVFNGVVQQIITYSGLLGSSFPDPAQVLSEKPPELEPAAMATIQIDVEDQRPIRVVRSWDPNDKAGPSGFGDHHHVLPEEVFQYMIYFENVDTATSPAEDIFIVDTLDTDLSCSTCSFDTTSHVPTSKSFDPTTGVLTWSFEDINLQPNKTPPEGEGWVSFTIKPKQNLTSGTEIRNKGWIVFDVNPPMSTSEVLNTIDALPPGSNVLPLAQEQPLSTFAIQVSGADDEHGSGIRDYAIYVSDNDSPYSLWKYTDSTSVVFTAQTNHTYKFYSIARDNVGYIETAPSEPDAVTIVKSPTGVEVSPNPYVPTRGHEVISFFGAGLPGSEIKIFNKAGELVRTLEEKENKDRFDWDARNDDGKDLASGVYIYVVKEKTGKTHKGKFAIIR